MGPVRKSRRYICTARGH